MIKASCLKRYAFLLIAVLPLSLAACKTKAPDIAKAPVVTSEIYVPQVSTATNCTVSNEQEALNSRVLQTDLMVAALSCGEQKNYNSFVTKFKPALGNRGKLLKAYFARVYGSKSEKQMNDFITRLANDSSKRSLDTSAVAFCASAKALFNELQTSNAEQLTLIAARKEFAARHGVGQCRQVAMR